MEWLSFRCQCSDLITFLPYHTYLLAASALLHMEQLQCWTQLERFFYYTEWIHVEWPDLFPCKHLWARQKKAAKKLLEAILLTFQRKISSWAHEFVHGEEQRMKYDPRGLLHAPVAASISDWLCLFNAYSTCHRWAAHASKCIARPASLCSISDLLFTSEWEKHYLLSGGGTANSRSFYTIVADRDEYASCTRI